MAWKRRTSADTTTESNPWSRSFSGKSTLRHLGLVRELLARKVLKKPPLTPRYLDDPEAQRRLAGLSEGGLPHQLPGLYRDRSRVSSSHSAAAWATASSRFRSSMCRAGSRAPVHSSMKNFFTSIARAQPTPG